MKVVMRNRKTDEERELKTKGTAEDIMPTAIKQHPPIACRSGQQDFLEWSM
jgi:hypothetical protein